MAWKQKPGCFVWTEEADAEVQRLLMDGDTAAQISAALSAKLGVFVTRSAVLGRIHRKEWAPGRPQGLNANKRQRRVTSKLEHGGLRVIRKAPAPPVAPAPMINLTPTLRFFDRSSNDCAWPEGEPSNEMMCCGRPAIEGRPYCLIHCQMAYYRPGDYRRARVVERRVA